jgi:predicted RNA-binding protein associated with RNAse of E/G family
MLPGHCHSVLLFWDGTEDERRFSYYFVNMEEPLRRTPIGVDTQDHTIDINVNPDLTWTWRDEMELANHVSHGYYTADLALAARLEGERVIKAIVDGTHPCRNGWDTWSPDPTWQTPGIPSGWDTTAPTFWDWRLWAYGETGIRHP